MNNIFFFRPSNFCFEIIIFAPFLMAWLINLLPSILAPFIAKKILPFLHSELLKQRPEKYWLLYFDLIPLK